ncbi:uncharacterized protein LOC121421103 [Lytechinus variegatus]|uniref:uncharacterized protein LOC121421103 n=1 Tax=Lytechinus variegatus TaxID=7654 RepID=UPI001BB192FD|nr:uncharacterized protein LOC121421103 [Lytechinus variegatus]
MYEISCIILYRRYLSFQTPATSGVELGQQSVADSNSNTSGQKKSKDIDFKDTLTRVLEASRAESTVKKYKRAVEAWNAWCRNSGTSCQDLCQESIASLDLERAEKMSCPCS